MFYPINLFLATLLFIISVVFIPLTTKLKKRNYYNWQAGVFINLTFLFLGILLNQAQNELTNSNHFTKIDGNYLILKVNEQPIYKAKSVKVITKVIGVINKGNQLNATGNLLVYFSKDSVTQYPLYGDIIIVKAKYNQIPGPQNPNEFNYKRYLSFNQIHYQTYLNKGSFINTEINIGNHLFSFAYSVQQYIKTVLGNFVKTKSEVGVAQALLYGYDDEIDPDILRAYSNTGTLHVLAVSGMHVGIIFWVLNLLLAPLEKNKKLKIIKQLLLLVFVWGYSVLCGLSPSILRATVMISIFVFAEFFNRTPNVFNTLAVSAFLLIVYNSNIVANVGFQLSYLAVLGIVGVHPFLYKQLVFNSWLGDNIWKIISVSIAAQFSTFPIGLLYFHQFPVYFLFSNLLIIPLTTAIIYLGILLIAVSKLSIIAVWIGVAVKWLIFITNGLVIFVEKLPFAYINGISITIAQCIIIYIICVSFFAYLVQPYKLFLKAFLWFVFVFCVYIGLENISKLKARNITFYHVKNNIAINYTIGNNTVLIADSSIIANQDKFHFHIQQHIWASKINYLDTVCIHNDALKIDLQNLTLWLNAFPAKVSLTKNYVVFTGNNFISLKDSALNSAIEAIIINNNMSAKKQESIVNFATKHKIKYYLLAKTAYAQFTF